MKTGMLPVHAPQRVPANKPPQPGVIPTFAHMVHSGRTIELHTQPA